MGAVMIDGHAEDAGLNLFNDRATAAGSFPTALRGYDRHAVDSYVRDLERELGELRQLVTQLRAGTNGAESHVTSSLSDFGRLSAHTQRILMDAEAHATELRSQAATEAERVKEEARRSAAEVRAAAEREAEALRLASEGALRELREQHASQQNEVLERARVDAEALVTGAQRQAEAAQQEARVVAENLVESARLEAARLVNEAEQEATAKRQAVLAEQGELLDKARNTHDEAVARVEVLLAESAREHQLADERLTAQVETAKRRLQEALKEAEAIRTAAIAESEAHVASAHARAAEAAIELEEDLAWRKEQLEREIATLQQRKQLIVGQMQNLGAMGKASVEDLPADEALAPEPPSARPSRRRGKVADATVGAPMAEPAPTDV